MAYGAYRILIIDDEKDIGSILDTVLRREGFEQVKTTYSTVEGLAEFKKWQPHLVLLDIMLPDGDGYALFNTLKAYQASVEKAMVPVLFISAKDEEMDRILGFALGADDYITKPFSPKEVAYRVKARLKMSPVNALEQWNRDSNASSQLNPSVIRFGEVTIQVDAGEVWRGGHLLAMTAKEFKLLLYLAQNPNRILSKETLGEAVWGEIVWGDDYQGFDNTLSVHMRKLRLKIEEDPAKPKWLQTVIGLGYKFVMRQEGENP